MRGRGRASQTAEEADMLTSRRCPHTGIVNYYNTTDPFLSVGSVQRQPVAGAAWRCYIADHPASGAASDVTTAERQLKAHVRTAERQSAEDRIAAAA